MLRHPLPRLLRILGFASLALLGTSCASVSSVSSIPSVPQVTPVPPAEARIPDRRVNLADFGGVPDGATLNTAAFERALASLAERGGGTLLVPSGYWLTGPIRLRSRIRIHLETGALIRFSGDHRLYPLTVHDYRGEKFVNSLSPISGDKLEDVAITGSGVIDGSGDAWRYVKRGKLTPPAWTALVKSGGVLNPKGDEWWPSQAALDGRAAVEALSAAGSLDVAAYAPFHQFLRPRLVRLIDCRRVLLEGVTFRNSPEWTLNPVLCEDVALRDLKIFNPRSAQNSDAMDIESCRRVHVRGCLIDTGDDGICLKSGKDEIGRRIGAPTRDVLVEDCTVLYAHGGFVIGSEMSGGVHDVLVRNCTFVGTAIGLRFKTARGRGGVVENIHVDGVRMHDLAGAAVSFDFFYARQGVSATVPPVDEGTPEFRRMLIENIVSRDAGATLVLRGLPEKPLRDITLRDVSVSGAKGADLAYCDGIVFERVQVRAASGEPLKTEEVKNSRLPLSP